MQAPVRSTVDTILKVEKFIAFATFLAMVTALGADVAGREIFKAGVFGSVKFSVYALIFCAMAGFGIATATGSHLRPNFLDKVVPKSMQGLSIRLGQVISAAILLALAWAGWQMVQFSISIEEIDLTLNIPVWTIQLAIPVGFVLSALRHLAYATFPELQPIEKSVAE